MCDVQDLYYACRRWTIATYQHVTEEDYAIRLLGGNIFTLGRAQRGLDGNIDAYSYEDTAVAGE